MKQKFSLHSQNGGGLIEVLIAGCLGIGILMAISGGLAGMTGTSRKLESSMDLSAIKAKVVDAVSCSKTLAAAPACTTTGGYVALKNKLGTDVIAINGSQIGRFLLRARCDAGATGGIDVRAARLTPAGMSAPNALEFDFATPDSSWYQKDEVNKNLPYNWAHPKGQILSSVTGNDLRLCKEFFSGTVAGGTVTCPVAGQVMIGFNPVDNSVACVDAASLIPTAAPAPAPTAAAAAAAAAATPASVPTAYIASIQCSNGKYLQSIVNNLPVCKTLPSSTTTTTTTSAPPSSPSLMWHVQSDNFDCVLNTAAIPIPTCSGGVAAGVGCSTLNQRCRSTWTSTGCATDVCSTGTCRRLFKCF